MQQPLIEVQEDRVSHRSRRGEGFARYFSAMLTSPKSIVLSVTSEGRAFHHHL